MMKFFVTFCAVKFVSCIVTPNTVLDRFQTNGIIPDVLDVAPPIRAQIIYGTNLRVRLGDTVTPAQTRIQPRIRWPIEPNTLYTLVMLDLDAPSRQQPTSRSIRHWLVGNIRGGNTNSGEVLSSYLRPQPSNGSGLHRYVILVYKQTARIAFSENQNDNIANFSLRNFVSKYNLGAPVAGNFFQAQWDATVTRN